MEIVADLNSLLSANVEITDATVPQKRIKVACHDDAASELSVGWRETIKTRIGPERRPWPLHERYGYVAGDNGFTAIRYLRNGYVVPYAHHPYLADLRVWLSYIAD